MISYLCEDGEDGVVWDFGGLIGRLFRNLKKLGWERNGFYDDMEE
jgi:hypothetical protein